MVRRLGLSSIRWRAALMTSALVAVVLTLFTAYAVRRVANDVVQRAMERSENSARLLASQSGQSVQQNLRRIQDLGGDAAVRALLDAPDAAPLPGTTARLEQLASGAGDQTLELWDAHGRRLLTVGVPRAATSSLPPAPVPVRAGFDPLQLQGGRVFSRVTAALIDPAAHGSANPTILGYVVSSHVVNVGASPLLSALVGEGARVFVGNAAGDVWTDFDRALPAPAVDVTIPGARSFRGPGGEDLIGSPVTVPGTPWVLLVALPRAVIIQPVWHLFWQLVVAGVAFTALATALAAALSLRVATPLVELTDAAQAIAGGAYESRVRARGQDEVGRLAAAFNLMAQQVEQTRAELVTRAKELSVSREDARQANQAKDEFLAVLSHELRSPLSAVLGWCHLLRTAAVPPDRVPHALEIIERNARTQLSLVEDLLDVSRMVAGKFTVDLRPIDPSTVVRTAVESLQPAATAKHVSVDLQMESHLGFVRADSGRLQQVVGNLLSNALKFTPSGGRITVAVARAADTTQIVVQDTGEGIDANSLSVIFDRLHQAETHAARKHAGLGLGLAIVRQVVELHGGSVHAESEGRGRGATFRVVLPAVSDMMGQVAEQSLPPTANTATVPARSLQGLRCLVVDDSADAREVVAFMLTAAGAEVTTVAAADAALTSFERRIPDVLISDLEMPDQSGFELVTRIRSWPSDRGGAVAAVAVTAYASLDDRERSRRAGFDAHVAKPVNERELIRLVLRAVDAREGARAAGAHTHPSRPVPLPAQAS